MSSGNSSKNFGCVQLNAKLFSANSCFSAVEVSIEPLVLSDSSMKEYNPKRIVDTDQSGFHVSGWKSDIERHNLTQVLKRPLGVVIEIEGGLNG